IARTTKKKKKKTILTRALFIIVIHFLFFPATDDFIFMKKLHFTISEMHQETLHVEICQQINSTESEDKIKQLVAAELHIRDEITLNKSLLSKDFYYWNLKNHILSIFCSFGHENKTKLKLTELFQTRFYIYRLNQEEAAIETMDKDGEEISASSHWVLPSIEFADLWENLYYNPKIKENLLNFVETAMIYAERKVNPHVISWNKVVLLHGPPGTGKTSLCKALAQKLTIRLGNRFTRGELVEINSHSLFSKWFSESGKLVMSLFNSIKTLLEDQNALVCILIDEIESLAHARKACSNGTEPSDSIRVVNALLTQLDSIKRYPNVLILTTSNLTEAIDLAFVDRADIKQYIGPPNEQAIYKIYSDCIKELMRTEFIEKEIIEDYQYLKMQGFQENQQTKYSIRVLQLCKQSEGMSGRTLRKIPFLAHALFMSMNQNKLKNFLAAMVHAIEKQKTDGLEVQNNTGDKV
ncbi:hypothetical protein TSAR_012578, partial [Trichomalopsis sarcophagae]